ncbi:toll/interleukin-1 receptor (TIR) domain-containing protein [Artemisia annua]|uniref:Toll/interleukin-1 receptor (TIR) domain-containing protein n=1 Tax=Artemisia annua TaxID=35608 RepID=A0A2U1LQL4_ARTAN|nr:toll/interleukin-1 receptor (TIR) domain-containing protein [Artemisia annua]
MIESDPVVKAKAIELIANRSLTVEERSTQLADFINSRSDDAALYDLMGTIKQKQSQKRKRKPTKAQFGGLSFISSGQSVHDVGFLLVEGRMNWNGLTIDMRMVKKEILRGSFELKTDAFSNMNSLMILNLDNVQINGPYEKFPEELRWLHMCGFPLKSLVTSNLLTCRVVTLTHSKAEKCYSISLTFIPFQQMTGSCSTDDRLLGSLKIINLSYCYKLNCIAGFCELPMLESLFLRNCTSLTEVNESIDHCDELVFIDLSNCKEFIRMLPRTLAKLKKVENLVLDGCNIGELAKEVVPRDSKSLMNYL